MRRFTWPLLALTAAAALLVPLAAPGKQIMARHRPEAVEAGRFEGTWYHVAAHLQMALWIRETDLGYEVRLEWRARSGLRFATDWKGDARYSLRGFPGNVTLSVDPDKTDANVIAGTYERSLELDEGDYHLEGGPFRIERTGDGSSLVWSFDPYTQEKRIAGRVESGSRDDIFFEMLKASFRIVQYDDIPW